MPVTMFRGSHLLIQPNVGKSPWVLFPKWWNSIPGPHQNTRKQPENPGYLSHNSVKQSELYATDAKVQETTDLKRDVTQAKMPQDFNI